MAALSAEAAGWTVNCGDAMVGTAPTRQWLPSRAPNDRHQIAARIAAADRWASEIDARRKVITTIHSRLSLSKLAGDGA